MSYAFLLGSSDWGKDYVGWQKLEFTNFILLPPCSPLLHTVNIRYQMSPGPMFTEEDRRAEAQAG